MPAHSLFLCLIVGALSLTHAFCLHWINTQRNNAHKTLMQGTKINLIQDIRLLEPC